MASGILCNTSASGLVVPQAAPTACPKPGCGGKIRGHRPCDQCPREAATPARRRRVRRHDYSKYRERQTADEARRRAFYGRQAWARLRNTHIRKNPLCADCYSRGRVVAGDAVDHIVELRDDPTKGMDPTNLQTLCNSCHAVKTNDEKKARERRLSGDAR